jgi:hypothetical protein
MKYFQTSLLAALALGSALSASAQVTEILTSTDTYLDIWGDGQTKRDGETVMAARNSTTSSNVVLGFRELSGVPMTNFDVSGLTPGDLAGKTVLYQVALAGFNIDPGSDGATLGVYNVLRNWDSTAILFGPKVDFVGLTQAVDWDGNDYLGGATFPGQAIDRRHLDLIATADLTPAFLADSTNAWNLYTDTLSFDVTALVTGWVDGSIPNNGLALWVDPNFALNQAQEQINFTTLENPNATGVAGGSSPARLVVVPEPSTYVAIFGLAALATLLVRRRKAHAAG